MEKRWLGFVLNLLLKKTSVVYYVVGVTMLIVMAQDPIDS